MVYIFIFQVGSSLTLTLNPYRFSEYCRQLFLMIVQVIPVWFLQNSLLYILSFQVGSSLTRTLYPHTLLLSLFVFRWVFLESVLQKREDHQFLHNSMVYIFIFKVGSSLTLTLNPYKIQIRCLLVIIFSSVFSFNKLIRIN